MLFTDFGGSLPSTGALSLFSSSLVNTTLGRVMSLAEFTHDNRKVERQFRFFRPPTDVGGGFFVTLQNY